MDAFEALVALLLRRDGYWTKTSFKVNLTKEEKRHIGCPSSPRRELDVVAYKGSTNEILAVECKSYLNSRGVSYEHLVGHSPNQTNPYKLFNDAVLRKTVLKRLRRQVVKEGACAPKPKVQLCLAAGNIVSPADHERLRKHFSRHRWRLFDREWLVERIKSFGESAYENDIAIVVAKLLTG